MGGSRLCLLGFTHFVVLPTLTLDLAMWLVLTNGIWTNKLSLRSTWAVPSEYSALEPSCLCKLSGHLLGSHMVGKAVSHSKHSSWGPNMWVRPSWTRQSWTQSRDACWHGRELKNHLAEPCTHSWPTESWEINCCFKLLSSEVVQGGNRNTFHNEYQNYLSEPLMTCDLGFSNWVKINSEKRKNWWKPSPRSPAIHHQAAYTIWVKKKKGKYHLFHSFKTSGDNFKILFLLFTKCVETLCIIWHKTDGLHMCSH